MSEALTLSQRLHTGWAHLTGLFAGGKLSTQDSQAQNLPVNLGAVSYTHLRAHETG
jgi:hypothetical protein